MIDCHFLQFFSLRNFVLFTFSVLPYVSFNQSYSIQLLQNGLAYKEREQF